MLWNKSNSFVTSMSFWVACKFRHCVNIYIFITRGLSDFLIVPNIFSQFTQLRKKKKKSIFSFSLQFYCYNVVGCIYRENNQLCNSVYRGFIFVLYHEKINQIWIPNYFNTLLIINDNLYLLNFCLFTSNWSTDFWTSDYTYTKRNEALQIKHLNKIIATRLFRLYSLFCFA